MSLAKKIEETKIQSNVILITTKHITEEDLLVDVNWRKIHSEYMECNDSEWLTQATVTLFNSIYHQKRKVFGLSRESLRSVLKSDKNWNKPIGLKDSNYRKFLDHVFRGKLLENIPYEKAGSNNKLMVVKVIHPDLLAMFDFDMDIQLSESLAFAKKQGNKNISTAKPLKERLFKVTDKIPTNQDEAFDFLQEKEQMIISKTNAVVFRTKEWHNLMKAKKTKEAWEIEKKVLNQAALDYLKLSTEDKNKFVSEHR